MVAVRFSRPLFMRAGGHGRIVVRRVQHEGLKGWSNPASDPLELRAQAPGSYVDKSTSGLGPVPPRSRGYACASPGAAELGCLLIQEQPFHVGKRLSRVERSRRRLRGPEELEQRPRLLVADVCGQKCREWPVPVESRWLRLGRTRLRSRIADREAVRV